ncbi:hypothetical protein Tco_1061952 [Tanacetum coccineum]
MTGPPMYNAFRCFSSKFFVSGFHIRPTTAPWRNQFLALVRALKLRKLHPEGINNTVADLHDQHGDMRLNVDNMSYEFAERNCAEEALRMLQGT